MNCVVITGSTRGIGFGLALEFLRNNYSVIINGTSEKSVQNAMLQLSDYQGKVYGYVGRVQDKDFGFNLYNFACEKFKVVHIWINNAGINQPLVKAWDLSFEEINGLIEVNVCAVINNTRQVYRAMKEQGHGKIFNMEGLGSDGRMIDKTALYGTSKRALAYFTKAFSKECEDTCVQVGIISPGMVITDFILEPIKKQSTEDANKAKRIFNLLGSRVEDITPFLVKEMINTTKHYPRIEYLTNTRIMGKLLRHLFNRQDYFI